MRTFISILLLLSSHYYFQLPIYLTALILLLWNYAVNQYSHPRRRWNKIIADIKRENNKVSRGKALCIVNPISGGGLSREYYDNLIKPMLTLRGWTIETLYTQKEFHAWEFCQEYKEDVDMVVVVSGDGLFNEVANGFLFRKSLHKKPVPPFVLVPLGTSNGIFASLYTPYRRDDPLSRAMTALDEVSKGQGILTPVDVIELEFLSNSSNTSTKAENKELERLIGRENKMHSFVSVSVGLIADSDYYQEIKLRWMPGFLLELRVMVAQAISFLSNNKYKIKIKYEECEVQPDGQVAHKRTVENEGRYAIFCVVNVPWLSYEAQCAPDLKINDGTSQILIMNDEPSLLDLIRALLVAETAGHLKCKGTTIPSVTAVTIEPKNELVLAVDGHLLKGRPIRTKVVPGGIHFLLSPTKFPKHSVHPLRMPATFQQPAH